MATVYNVFAIIRGFEEPDRYVILGNHRDAWTYGAVDPNSGTAALLDVARRFALLMRLGWSPRRTIILGSWDAEEFGMVFELTVLFDSGTKMGTICFTHSVLLFWGGGREDKFCFFLVKREDKLVLHQSLQFYFCLSFHLINSSLFSFVFPYISSESSGNFLGLY